MSRTNEVQREPDTETIVECVGCERRFLDANARDDELGDRCPHCGTFTEQSESTRVLVGDRYSISFAGGVQAEVRLSGDEELRDAVLSELRRTADDWRDRFEKGSNRSLTGHHQEAAIEAFPRPLNFLAADVIALNAVKWLEDQTRRGTHGAETVREQGLTANQRSWIETIAEKMEEADD